MPEPVPERSPQAPVLVRLEDLPGLPRPLLMVDCRRGADYRRGHIPGAASLDNFPYANERTDAEGMEKLAGDWRAMLAAAGIPFTGSAVFFDAGLENRAPRNALMARYLGHPAAHVLAGGMAAWLAAGGEPVRGPAEPSPLDPDSYPRQALRPWLLAGIDEVAGALAGPGPVLLDVRPGKEYEGRVRVQWNPRTGHLPGARSLPWVALLEKDPRPDPRAGTPSKFGLLRGPKPAAEIEAMLAAAGVDRESEVILYCQKSHRASNVYCVLEALGYRRLRVYPGSFREWSRQPELPVVRGPERL